MENGEAFGFTFKYINHILKVGNHDIIMSIYMNVKRSVWSIYYKRKQKQKLVITLKVELQLIYLKESKTIYGDVNME